MKISQGQIVVWFLSLTGRLPLSLCRLLGRIIGLALWLIPNRSRSTTKTNIAFCFPELSKGEQQKLVFKSLQHTGMLVFEMAAIWHQPYSWLEKKIVAIENVELFEQEQKKGVIILLPHVGNWEVFSRYIPAVSDGMGLYEPPRLPELEILIKKSREKTGGKLVPTNARGVASLLKHLRKGGTTCILPDQVPNHKDRSGVFAPFFGKPTYTMTLVNQLHQRTGSIIIGAAAKRVAGGFSIIFYPVGDAIYSEDNIASASAMNNLVERYAREIPEQYQWEYKRFRRVPPGESKVY
ncbi:MAG: lysophospholipid acyltransferase family protein [Cellvibrionaceae bacterium]